MNLITAKHSWFRKTIVMVLALVIILTYMPSEAFAQTNDWRPGSMVYFKNGDTLIGKDGKTYKSSYSSANRHAYTLKPLTGGRTVRGYCLQRMIMNPSNGSTKYIAKDPNKFMSSLNGYKEQGIKLALLYGKQADSTLSDMESLLGVSRSDANLDDWWLATQMIIWEYEQGLRKSLPPNNVGPGNLGTVASGGESADFNYRPIKGRPAAKVYFAMLRAMRDHKPIPRFTGISSKYAKTVYMEETSEGSGVWKGVNPKYGKKMTVEDRNKARNKSDYYILPDKNYVKQELKVMNGNNEDKAYTFKRVKSGQYTLTYKGKSLSTATKHGKKKMKEETKDNLLVWQSSGYQTIATGASDPVDFYFRLKPVGTFDEGGDRNDIEVFPEFQFPVHKDDKNTGWDENEDGSHCTGMGDAGLNSTFTLYRDGEEVDSITLAPDGSTDYLSDIPWLSSEDLPAKESGSYKHYTGDPEKLHCTVTPTDCTWDGNVTYTIKETSLPEGRLSEADSGTGTGERGTYKVTYHAETHNSQTCTNNKTNWSNIKYKITITDATGKKTVQEGTVENDDLEIDYVHEFEEQVFVNDNFRGDLQIVKTKDDQDPFTDKTNNDNGVKEYSKDSYWTIELESGGCEGCPYVRVSDEGNKKDGYGKYTHTYKATRDNSGTPADSKHPLKVSEDGQIYVYDIPYGTYIVKEIKADANGYVLEEFRISITKDGQKISKNVNNQQKKNKIKVVKTNAETGKTVRWDAERTAFRIRYKGNPDYADPTTSPNYNKYLPNGNSYSDNNQNYVFYANKNGEIVLPYQIEYGIYEIEELVVPEGYYVGQYDKDGKGSVADMGSVDIINHKGQTVTPPKTFLETVQVRDRDGKKVENFTGDNKTTYNKYRFTVLEQDAHMEGENYTTYYAIVDMPNNPAKGKIEITKNGEGFVGWNKGEDGGYSVWKSVWDRIRLGSAKFEIYAAEDIKQVDGVIPVKAFNAKTGKQIDLTKISRDHADIDGAKEVWQVSLETGDIITQTAAKDASKTNKTFTDYIIAAVNGATYKDSFTVRDDKKKMTYRYTVEYALNYSKGGFNYTDVHVSKKSISDDYVPEIGVTDPLLKSGEENLGFATMDYDGGNRVRVNRLDSEKDLPEDEVTGVYSNYDKVNAEIVVPKVETVQVQDEAAQPDHPVKEEEQVTNAPDVPDGWEKASDGWDAVTKQDAKNFIISKTEEGNQSYRIWINDGELRWADCDKDGNFYKSYSQEYYFTTAQHFKNATGFDFTWDNVIGMSTVADNVAEIATTEIQNHDGTTPKITESNVYTHKVRNGKTIFTGTPLDEAPVYFKTNDGIRTEMYLSGLLTHTRVTLSQDQLYVFDKTYPAISYNDEELDWNNGMSPDNPYYEKIFDDRNYIKAERHETGRDNKEVYYTIDMVSSNADQNKGFKITYPDTTEAVPIIMDGGKSAKLSFNSIDDTMVYPNGKPVEVITTNLKGIAESSALPMGTYWVREVASAAGHVNNGQWKKFTLNYKDQYTPLVWDTATYENQAVSVKIDLEKLFETAYESKEYRAGSGAVFGIYTAEKISGSTTSDKNVDKKEVAADTLVGRMVVSNGQASTTIKLPLGKYYVKEIGAPSGWKTNNTKYYFNAVDILTADQMTFYYKDIGVNGFVTQDGNNGLTVDFDTLYRYNAAKVNIDGKDYSMDTNFSEEGSNVSVAVMDGRTNTQIRVKDGQSTTIKFENGATIIVKAEGQTYTATLDGEAPTKLETGADENENFTKTIEGSKTIIKYQPKVTKTNWLSEVTYKYAEPKKDATDEEKAKLTSLLLTSPEGTSSVKADVSYDYGKATLTLPTGTATGITKDGKKIESLTEPVILERIIQTPVKDKETNEQMTDKDGNPLFDTQIQATKAIINFADGVTYTVEFDTAGNLYMSASGEVEKNLNTESILTMNGKVELPKIVNLKNTTAKTYARNNTNAGVLNITINGVKNDKLPETPYTPVTPSVSTTAKDSDTNDRLTNADSKATIIDTVKYSNLTVGKEYTLSGVLMDKETGRELLVNGKKVTAEKTFTAETSNGSIDIEFTFNASALEGKTTVVFETLKSEGREIAAHTDINDEGQTVQIPKIRTTALDSETEEHITNADSKATIIDTVKYSNLIVGKEYTVSGVLMDKETGKELLVNGKKVTAEKTFTADRKDGSIDLEFTFNASALEGKTVVVFETMKYSGKKIAVHSDINDKDQSIYIPKVRTTAALNGDNKIVDKVSYSNLIKGKTYTVKGVLMDKETKKPVTVDGEEITAEKTFTAEKSSGIVELTFKVDTSKLEGKTTVVFEELYLDEHLVGKHKNINDKDQTVVIPVPEKPVVPSIPTGPDTGDKTSVAIYLILLFAAIAASIIICGLKRRKK